LNLVFLIAGVVLMISALWKKKIIKENVNANIGNSRSGYRPDDRRNTADKQRYKEAGAKSQE